MIISEVVFFIELVRTEMEALKFVLQNACNLSSLILLIEGVNGVNRLAKKGKKYY